MPEKNTSKANGGNEKGKNKNGTAYNAKDIEYIKKNYRTTSVKDMALYLGRTEHALRNKISNLGIRLANPDKKTKHVWTDGEKSYLEKSYNEMTDAEMAERLGVGRLCVLRQRKRMGLALNPGDRFDTKGYKQLRIGGKRILKHRYVVAKSIGRPLSKKERVHHIDLDKRNNDIENLYLCKNEREHGELHWNLNRVASNLVKKKLIIFNKDIGEYGLSVLLEELAKRVDG